MGMTPEQIRTVRQTSSRATADPRRSCLVAWWSGHYFQLGKRESASGRNNGAIPKHSTCNNQDLQCNQRMPSLTSQWTFRIQNASRDAPLRSTMSQVPSICCLPNVIVYFDGLKHPIHMYKASNLSALRKWLALAWSMGLKTKTQSYILAVSLA
jgi:hypothetical protein